MRVVYTLVFVLSFLAVIVGGCATPSDSGKNPTGSTDWFNATSERSGAFC